MGWIATDEVTQICVTGRTRVTRRYDFGGLDDGHRAQRSRL
jgi:hypothetical protein